MWGCVLWQCCESANSVNCRSISHPNVKVLHRNGTFIPSYLPIQAKSSSNLCQWTKSNLVKQLKHHKTTHFFYHNELFQIWVYTLVMISNRELGLEGGKNREGIFMSFYNIPWQDKIKSFTHTVLTDKDTGKLTPLCAFQINLSHQWPSDKAVTQESLSHAVAVSSSPSHPSFLSSWKRDRSCNNLLIVEDFLPSTTQFPHSLMSAIMV